MTEIIGTSAVTIAAAARRSGGLPDRPENHEEITWTLEEREGAAELTIAERNLPSVEAKAASEQAWRTAVGNLRALLEEGLGGGSG